MSFCFLITWTFMSSSLIKFTLCLLISLCCFCVVINRDPDYVHIDLIDFLPFLFLFLSLFYKSFIKDFYKVYIIWYLDVQVFRVVRGSFSLHSFGVILCSINLTNFGYYFSFNSRRSPFFLSYNGCFLVIVLIVVYRRVLGTSSPFSLWCINFITFFFFIIHSDLKRKDVFIYKFLPPFY